MRLEYRLTLNDYLAAMEADGKVRNPWLFKSSLLWCATICGIISALISMFFDITFSIYMFLGAIFISPPIFKRFYRWQLSGHFKNDPRLNECLTVDLDENTIKFASDNSISKIKWEGFYHFIEADNVFNFYTSKITYHIIPKRAFINSEKLDIFRNIVVKKINNDCQFFSSANITIKRKYFYISGCAIFLAIVAIAIGTAIFDKGHYYWLNEGNDLYAAKRYEEALDSYKKALDIDSENVETWHSLGFTLDKLERYEEALASYDNALDIDPEYTYVWIGRGDTLRNLKRYEEALASYNKALDIAEPGHPYTWRKRGDTLRNLKRYKEALASYDNALDIDPEYANTWHNRGLALANLKRYEEALTSYNKTLDIDPAPGYPYAWKNRGDTLQWLNRYEEALASYDKALEIDPEYVKAWSNRGLTLRKLKRYKEAVASHDKALEIDPNYKLAINNRQRLLTELGLSE